MSATGGTKLLCHSEVAGLLDIHRCTLHRWRNTGLIPEPIYISGLPRWRPDEIYAWLEAGAPRAEKWNQIKRKVGNGNFSKMVQYFDDKSK